jgi:hypothetical protein
MPFGAPASLATPTGSRGAGIQGQSERESFESEVASFSLDVALAAVQLYIAWHARTIAGDTAMERLGRVLALIGTPDTELPVPGHDTTARTEFGHPR